MSATTSTHSLPAITDATFAAEVAPGTGLVAVDFSAEWCGPCRLMTPVMEAVARELAPTLRVFEIDADTNPRTTAQFGVLGLPTVLVFRDGTLVDRIVGAAPRSAVRERINRLVAK